MTPSRWLFVTTLATATGISIADTHAPLGGQLGCAILLVAALVRWRGGVRAGLWSLLVISAGVYYASSALPWSPPQPAWLVHSRSAFVHALTLAMPEREAHLGAGMLLGVTDGIEKSLQTAFRTAGVTHLLAVSGANLSLVLAAFTTTGVLVRSRRGVFGLTIVLAPTFALFTNAEPSILRAAAMAILGTVMVACGRRAAPVNLLAAASVGVLLLDPTLLWGSVGFQLSIAATFGLVTLSQPFTTLAGRLHLPGRTLIAPTFAATVTTLPVILLAFGRASLVSPLANLAIGPLVPIIMVLVVSIGVVTLALPVLGTILGVVGWALLRSVQWLAVTAAQFPAASVTLVPPLALALAGVATLGTLVLIRHYAPKIFA